ncbi:MAG: cytochrome c maturation protein CcmE [Candidatus Dadabacteria bacterium]|nr:cytochrome c maturation protein CcmE [Candidatus Dadabacteria bacterium]NIS08768.1 cytochrome c maturation protein CcmE [Candidatus Dadabacteria bacterium]NIV42711.1 cytochrome c maturation protein CcmE [Candidatus Dadabacteria bacterium]NIX15454.1 cytochrome c maturation protein CcmE [Candidatus Dadabacteria bacterium]NIY22116.1 cytochrome c maturation protein CcmE [Candidatus Dadabacteria bacterium]
MFKGRSKFIIAIGAIVVSVGYLIFTGVSESGVYYLKIDELKKGVPATYKQKVRVSGTVVEGSIINEINGKLKFAITDGSELINVKYSGIVPDIFADGVEAVVEGSYNPDNSFDADLLLAKCPTKYESTDSLQKSKKTS